MKKLICGLLIIILLNLVFPITSFATAGTLYESWTGTTSGLIAVDASNWIAQTFTPDVSHKITSARIKIYRGVEDILGSVHVEIYAVDIDHKPTGTKLCSSSATVISLATSSGNYKQFNFTDGATLASGTEYAIVARATVSSAVVWEQSEASNPYADGTQVNSGNAGSTWTVQTSDMGFEEYGTWAPVAGVVTLNAIINDDNSVSLTGLVSALGGNGTVHRYFEWGTDTDYGDTIDCDSSSGVLATGRYTSVIRNLPQSTEFHYRAYIVGNDTSVRYNGSDKTFTISDAGKPIVLTSDPYDISYDSAYADVELISLGSEADVDLYLETSTNGTSWTPDELSLGEDELGSYVAEITLSTGVRCYFRAKAVGTTYTVYGDVKQVTALDPNKPAQVNFINNMLNGLGLGEAFWWVILLIAMICVWIPQVVRQHPVIGIIGDLMILGAGIAMSVIDVWIIVLLALGAGVVAFTLIFKRSQA